MTVSRDHPDDLPAVEPTDETDFNPAHFLSELRVPPGNDLELKDAAAAVAHEFSVFIAQLLQSLGVGNLHAPFLTPRSVEGLFADIELPTDLLKGLLPIRLAENTDDFFSGMSFFLHG